MPGRSIHSLDVEGSATVQRMPQGFPLAAIDAAGHALSVGASVRILSVESCAKGLPQEDQERLRALIGQARSIVEVDRFGFVWLCFSGAEGRADFSLVPNEVQRV